MIDHAHYESIFKNLLKQCVSEKEKEQLKKEFVSLLRISGSSASRAEEILSEIENKADDRRSTSDSR